MNVIVDSDSIAYQVAGAIGSLIKKGELLEDDKDQCLKSAYFMLKAKIKQIHEDLNANDETHFHFMLSGKKNYRYDLYPEYKANRKDTVKPPYLSEVRDILITKYNAFVTEGIEADDMCGIVPMQSKGEWIIAHIDKDIDTIPGDHYDYMKRIRYTVSEKQAVCNLYMQSLTGDTCDNIPGLFKMTGRKCTKKIKEGLTDLMEIEDINEMNQSMWEYVVEQFQYTTPEEKEPLIRNLKCLWIQHEEGVIWEPPGMEEDWGLSEPYDSYTWEPED